jgi:hypothetical protein
MSTGRCPRCQRLYTAGEVAGLGILRPRPERQGGPLVEFACPGCDRVLRLVPHGEGRYAPPGEPAPEPVPPADRRPPWIDEGAGAEAPPPSPVAEEPVVEIEVDEEAVLTPAEALEVLGLEPTADPAEIERAYRQRSMACHPDKVAHLDAEFQALAERKFRRVRAAYELLRS